MATNEPLIEKLNNAMSEVMNARGALLTAKEAALEAKEDLKSTECHLLDAGKIVGKNEKEREASARLLTFDERQCLIDAEKAERTATLRLEIALDARRNLESVIRIMEMK
jgi:hypothetical protein